MPLKYKKNSTQLSLHTNARSAIRCQLESLVTVAHEGAVRVEAAVTARLIFTLIHIWKENSGGQLT